MISLTVNLWRMLDFKDWPTILTVKTLRDYFYEYVEIQVNLE